MVLGTYPDVGNVAVVNQGRTAVFAHDDVPQLHVVVGEALFAHPHKGSQHLFGQRLANSVVLCKALQRVVLCKAWQMSRAKAGATRRTTAR